MRIQAQRARRCENFSQLCGTYIRNRPGLFSGTWSRSNRTTDTLIVLHFFRDAEENKKKDKKNETTYLEVNGVPL